MSVYALCVYVCVCFGYEGICEQMLFLETLCVHITRKNIIQQSIYCMQKFVFSIRTIQPIMMPPDTRKLLVTADPITNGTMISLEVNCTFVNQSPSSGCLIEIIDTGNMYFSTELALSGTSVRFRNLRPSRYAVIAYGKQDVFDEITLTFEHSYYTLIDVTDAVDSGSRSSENFSMTGNCGICVCIYIVMADN